MGFAMQAAAKANIPFIVLDRPNPIAALHIEGFTLEAAFKSFIGLYQIPVTHGMTVGELANLIKGERLLESLENLSLRVILVEGWQRTMLWSDLRMPWVPPSPNLPSFESAVIYPGTCFFGGKNPAGAYKTAKSLCHWNIRSGHSRGAWYGISDPGIPEEHGMG